MTAETICFEHKALLQDLLRGINTQISEYSFPNIYLFRDAHHYELIRDREIFIRGITYDGHSYLMPTKDVCALDRKYLKDMMASCEFLFPIPEEWLPYFREEEFVFSVRKGEMDYLYTVEQMSTYRGRNLHQKRNLLKRFMSSYSHESLPLIEERIPDAVAVLKAWQAEAEQDEEMTDYGPCLEALHRYDDLMLCGGIYYADKEAAGFILGEELNEKTFVIHFAKAKKKFTGIYQFMFNNFAFILPVKYRYLNLEQDLDKQALRVAKSSYQPAEMLKKFRVSLKKDSPRFP